MLVLTFYFSMVTLSNSKSVQQPQENQSEQSSSELSFFEPLPQTIVTATCSWKVRLNTVENRIPGITSLLITFYMISYV